MGGGGNRAAPVAVSAPMKKTERSRLATLFLGLTLLLAACGGAASSGSPAPGSTADPNPSSSPGGGSGTIDGTGDWRLVSGTNAGAPIPLVPGSDITMTVDGSQISGRSACNQYGGEIIVANGQVQFGPLFMTEMACEEPVMASEAAYHAALAGVRAATRDGDTLTLSGEGVELIYERLAPPPVADIVGTVWVLESLITADAVSSVMGEPALLVLDPNGSFTGSTGCRSFTGRYTIANAEIMFTEFAMDQTTCSPELASQDSHVTSVLGDGFRAEVDGDRLTIAGTGNEGLGYMTKVPEVPQAP
jgi:heat shock protein HslJ